MLNLEDANMAQFRLLFFIMLNLTDIVIMVLIMLYLG